MNYSDTIKDTIKKIPECPGIYKMLDSKGNIIYIGKSKCLKKRVRSYFVNSPKWEKVNRMVSMIKDIEYIVTDTHLEARLLECEMIKNHQPRFNAQMKNDQRYIYVKVDHYNPYHSLSVVALREADCFGPFRSKYSMNEFIGKLKNIYPITKTACGYEFEYSFFPVKMKKEIFELNRNILLELLTEENNIQILIKAFQQKLEEAAAEYRYEIASYYRDIIIGFTNMKYGLDGYKNLASRNILLKLPLNNCYKLFFIANGLIRNSLIVPALADNIISDFLESSMLLSISLISAAKDEKSSIDFRDVLFSEISDLPEDMVVFADIMS